MATTIQASINEIAYSTKAMARIVNFLNRYPPSQYSSLATGQAIPTSKQQTAMSAGPLSSTNVPKAKSLPVVKTKAVDGEAVTEFEEMISSVATADAVLSSKKAAKAATLTFPPNPFLPYKNPATGRWRGARVGLRQQADLYKCARQLEVEDLLPPSIKSSVYKQQRILETGLAVKGTGQGQHVKGHKWERIKAGTLEKRRKAMEEMPGLVREWESRGHGRGWKKYPSGKSK